MYHYAGMLINFACCEWILISGNGIEKLMLAAGCMCVCVWMPGHRQQSWFDKTCESNRTYQNPGLQLMLVSGWTCGASGADAKLAGGVRGGIGPLQRHTLELRFNMYGPYLGVLVLTVETLVVLSEFGHCQI